MISGLISDATVVMPVSISKLLHAILQSADRVVGSLKGNRLLD